MFGKFVPPLTKVGERCLGITMTLCLCFHVAVVFCLSVFSGVCVLSVSVSMWPSCSVCVFRCLCLHVSVFCLSEFSCVRVYLSVFSCVRVCPSVLSCIRVCLCVHVSVFSLFCLCFHMSVFCLCFHVSGFCLSVFSCVRVLSVFSCVRVFSVFSCVRVLSMFSCVRVLSVRKIRSEPLNILY